MFDVNQNRRSPFRLLWTVFRVCNVHVPCCTIMRQRVGPRWWSGEWWSSLPIRNLPTPLRRDLVLLPRRMRIHPANLRNVARLAHRRKVLRREVVRTGKPEHAANLDRPPWPFGENRKNVVRHPPAFALW